MLVLGAGATTFIAMGTAPAAAGPYAPPVVAGPSAPAAVGIGLGFDRNDPSQRH